MSSRFGGAAAGQVVEGWRPAMANLSFIFLRVRVMVSECMINHRENSGMVTVIIKRIGLNPYKREH